MKRIRLWTMLCLLLMGWRHTTLAAPGAAGIITTASGQITIRRQGAAAFASLSQGGAFRIGDIVATGPTGKATLLFSDGSHVKLNSNTAIQITPPARVGNGHQSLFRALGGEVWARMRQGRAVQTRTAIAGVRGTEINMKVAEDGTSTLTVIEGEVDFSNEFGAVVVQQAQQSVARPGAAPTAPATVGNAGLLIEWTVDLNRAVIPRERFYISLNRQSLAGELQRRSVRAHSQPQDAAALRAYGDVLFDSHQYTAALTEYHAANDLKPDQPETLTRLGYTWLELDHLEDATLAFNAALKPNVRPVSLQPAALTRTDGSASSAPYAPALVGLSWVSLTHDAPEQAQEFATQAVAAANTVGARPAALQSLADAGPDATGNAVEAYVTLGLSLMRQPGKIDDAVTAFQAAQKMEPVAYRYQAHAWLALVDQAQGNADAALREAQTATKLEPYSASRMATRPWFISLAASPKPPSKRRV